MEKEDTGQVLVKGTQHRRGNAREGGMHGREEKRRSRNRWRQGEREKKGAPYTTAEDPIHADDSG